MMAARPALAVLALVGAAAARGEPITIAHRGASGYLPEHTLEAKALAHSQGADFIEQDVVLSKDDVPVVLHDVHLQAVSDVAERFPGRCRDDGRYYAIDFTLEELRQLRVSGRGGLQAPPPAAPPSPTDAGPRFRIPTLEEELLFLARLDAAAGRRTGVYPEIKQPAWHRTQGRDISPIVLAVLRKHGFATRADPCFLQCFEADELRRLRKDLGWEGRLVQLVGAAPRDAADPLLAPGVLDGLAKTVDGIGPPLGRIVRPDGMPTGLVAAAHAAGLVVHPYTFRIDRLPPFGDSPAACLRIIFAEARADGLFSDFPDVCVTWIRGNRSR